MSKETKDIQRGYYYDNAVVTDTQMKNLVDSSLGVLDSVENLPTASASNLGDEYKIGNSFYKCMLVSGAYVWVVTDNATPVTDYQDLTNKPRLEGVTLTKTTTLDQVGAISRKLENYKERTLTGEELCYVVHDDVVYKCSVSDLRKPNMVTVDIATTDWVNGKCYKQIDGISEESAVVASPHPDYAGTFFATPFWVSSVSPGMIEISSNNVPTNNVKLNVIFY